MLLVLDFSLIDEVTKPDVIWVLNQIAYSRYLGKHIIFGKIEVIKFFATCELLTEQSREIYSKIYADLPSLGRASLKKFVLSVEIVSGDVLEILDREGSKVIRASVDKFVNFSLLDLTVLLVENHDDILFYQRIVTTYRSWNNLGDVQIKYDDRSGGGQTTDKVFKKIQSSKEKFCLCLLDSDKKTPNSGLGTTAKNVLKINDQNQPLCDALALNVREIENLIPTSIYKEVFENDSNKRDAINFLETLDNSHLSDARSYLDIKKGLTLERVLKEKPQTAFRKYWLNFAKKFCKNLSTECLANEACSKKVPECHCFITLGLGDNIIKKVEEAYSNRDISHLISEDLKPEYERIGSAITSWCCASSPISTAKPS